MCVHVYVCACVYVCVRVCMCMCVYVSVLHMVCDGRLCEFACVDYVTCVKDVRVMLLCMCVLCVLSHSWYGECSISCRRSQRGLGRGPGCLSHLLPITARAAQLRVAGEAWLPSRGRQVPRVTPHNHLHKLPALDFKQQLQVVGE